jgi:hypothetical protein
MQKKYIVEFRVIKTVRAENLKDAEKKAREEIKEGKLGRVIFDYSERVFTDPF